MFWTASTDNDSNRIEVAKLDGSHRKILISHNLDEPRDICLVSFCVISKEEKILEDILDSNFNPSPSPSVKIQIIGKKGNLR